MSNYVGKTECMQCGHEVDVSLNRAGMAYYRCAPCGVHVQQKSERGNRMLLGKTRRFAEPEDTSGDPENDAQQPRESREITEQQPAQTKPATAAKPARRGMGFWGGT